MRYTTICMVNFICLPANVLQCGKDVSIGLIRAIIRELGITLDEWLELQSGIPFVS
jgi:hypothetical protein